MILMSRHSARFSLFLSLIGVAFAQSNGSITGTLKDSKGGVIAGAAISVNDPSQGVHQESRTNDAGIFVFAELPPGTYTLTAENPGFKKAERHDIVLPVSSKINIGDLVLEVGSVSETITVEAEAGQLQVESSSGERSDLVTNRQVRDLALNGRNVVDLFKTIPGVISSGVVANAASTVTNIVGNININGTRVAAARVHARRRDEPQSRAITPARWSRSIPDAVEEVKVLTSNYQAEYGRAGGGYIALTTRGGTNEFHGGARYFRRHDSLNADSYFNDAPRRLGGRISAPAVPLQLLRLGPWRPGRGFRKSSTAGTRSSSSSARNTTTNWCRRRHRSISWCPPRLSAAAISRTRWMARARRSPSSTRIRASRFPGNIIPASRIYAPGATILKFLPAPNTTAGGFVYNYTSQVPSSYPRRETIMRGDYQINSEHAPERPLGSQLRQSAVRVRNHHSFLELAARQHRPHERSWQRADHFAHAEFRAPPGSTNLSSAWVWAA